MRIASLFPAGTEIAFAVGAGDQLIVVSHACDYPEKARELPKATRPRFDPAGLSSSEIHQQKADVTRRFGSLYRLDESALWGQKPDVLLLPVPAIADLPIVSLENVRATAEGLKPRPRLVLLPQRGLDDVFDNLPRVGFEAGRLQEAQALAGELRDRVDAVEMQSVRGRGRSVAFLQWLDPPHAGGYWIPQMIETCGARDVLNEPGMPPIPVKWHQVRSGNADVLVVACEDMDIDRARMELASVMVRPECRWLQAVAESGALYLGDGPHFTRPTPRLVEGLEALAWAVHPKLFPAPPPEILRPLGA